MKFVARYSGIIVLLLAVLALEVQARDLGHDEALRLHQQGDILSLEQLVQVALDRYPGARLLEAELEDEDDVLVYEVELLCSDGTVRELELDARDGRVLKDEVED